MPATNRTSVPSKPSVEGQKKGSYRDMRLLHELEQSPNVTQRDLSRRIGIALGLTNLMLRRLVHKGHIKIGNTKGRRIRYLITPQGILEKSRLTVEYIQYSLYLYGQIRRYLRQQLASMQQSGLRRILLSGTGEFAEIAFLTIQEMGLELVGVVDGATGQRDFLGYRVRKIEEVPSGEYDRLMVACLQIPGGLLRELERIGIPPEKIITLNQAGLPVGPLTTPPAGGGQSDGAPPQGIPSPAELEPV